MTSDCLAPAPVVAAECWARWRRLPRLSPKRWVDDQPRRQACIEDRPDLGFDKCGRRRSRATDPNFRKGVKPANAGLKFPPQIYSPDEIHLLMQAAPDTRSWRRFPALIAFGYRSGLRISEILAVHEHHLDRERHRVVVERGKGGRSRYAQCDDWGFDMVEAWLTERRALPPGPVFCIACGPTAGERWSPAGVRQGMVRLKARAGLTKRLHPHALRHTFGVRVDA